MDKNEILEKSRKENDHKPDERELFVNGKASAVGTSVGILLCALVILLEALLTENYVATPAAWTVYWGIFAAIHTYKFAKLKQKHELVWGILGCVLSVLFLVFYMLKLTGTV